MRRILLCALVAGLAQHAAADDASRPPAPPIAWQDPQPFARLFLQLPFESPEVVAPGQFGLDTRVLYSNSIDAERAGGLSVSVNLETAEPLIVLRYGIHPGIEVVLAAPGLMDYAGFLARPIKIVESWFDTSNPLRMGAPPRDAHFRLVDPAGHGIDWVGTVNGSPGDVWAGVKVRVSEQSGRSPSVAVRAAVKFPTARIPFGSGEADLGAGLLAGWDWGATALRAEMDVYVPTATFGPLRVHTRPYGAAQLGLARRLGFATLHLQASAHLSAIADTGLDSIEGISQYLLAGATFDLGRHASADLAVIENILSPNHGADISGTLGLAARF